MMLSSTVAAALATARLRSPMRLRLLVLLAALAAPIGCAPQLVRTPNLYADTEHNPWDSVPPDLRATQRRADAQGRAAGPPSRPG